MRNRISNWRRLLLSLGSGNLRLIVLREGQSGLHQIAIRGKTAFYGLIILIIAAPLLFYLGSHLLLETAHAHRVAKLRRDNVALLQLVDKFENRIDKLEREFSTLTQLDKDLRSHADLPAIPDEIRQVGIGGSLAEIRTNMDYLLPSKDVSLAQITERLDALQRSLKLEQLSYEDIRDAIKGDLARLNSIPSVKPVIRGQYSSGFGVRRHPYTNQYNFHRGQDISVKIGTSVFATADGKVVATRFDENLGLYVKIKHSNGFHTLYGHLREISTQQGEIIKRGTLIGYAGDTGRSTAPHLHYEVRHYNQPQNPNNYY